VQQNVVMQLHCAGHTCPVLSTAFCQHLCADSTFVQKSCIVDLLCAALLHIWLPQMTLGVLSSLFATLARQPGAST
jgi:hypothetical protein